MERVSTPSTPLPPYAITWTVIPCLSHVMPLVGHLAITDSTGMQYDFGGDFYVHRDREETIFGLPCRYLQPELTASQRAQWDRAISVAVAEFEQQRYSFCCNNCHSFVARVFNEVGVAGSQRHSCASLVAQYRCRMLKLRGFCC